MNKISTLSLVVSAILWSQLAFSQCIPNPDPQPGLDCASAPFLCCGEVDMFSGTLPDFTNATGPSPLCNGQGVPNNTEFVAFAAGSSTLSLIITPSNCSTVPNPGGADFQGVQAGIYSGCDFSTAIACQGVCQTGAFSMSASNFVPGQVYFLFLDGCAGSVCDYTVTVTQGTTEAPPPGAITGITGLGINPTGQVCTGSTPSYTATAPFASAFIWEVTPAINYVDNGMSMQVVDWGAPGTYTICATPYNDCWAADPAGQVCQTVTVTELQDIQLPDGYYCENEPGYPVSINGVFQGNYLAGNHDIVISDPTPANCDQTYNINVFQNFNTNGYFSIDVCTGDGFTLPENGTTYPPSTADYFISLPGLNSNGCDSTLTLSVNEVNTGLSLTGGTVIDCENPLVFIFANVANQPQFPQPQYVWTTSDGNIFQDNGNNIVVDAAGTYSCQVFFNGFLCQSLTIDHVVTEGVSGGPTLTEASTPESCGNLMDGTATVTAMEAGTFTYTWEASAGAQGNNAVATGLAAGSYLVTVSDGNCESVTTVVVGSTPGVSIAIDSENDAACIGQSSGSATVTGSGGTGTLGYEWDANAGGATTPTVNMLAAGPYTVTVSDNLGCTQETTVNIGEPSSAISIALGNVAEASCGTSDGSIDVTTSGGTGPYMWSWSNTTTDEDLTGAPAGQYVLTATDANGCVTTLTESIPSANGPSIAIDAVNASCNGLSDGSLDLTITGGAAVSSIVWDNAPDVEDPTSLAAGSYAVTVTDANNCEVSGSVTITEPPVLTATVNASQTNCDQPTGSLQLTVSGGSPSYTYDWDMAPDVEDPSSLPAGTYNVVVMDSLGCTANAQGIIIEPAAPTGNSVATDVGCNGANDGVVTITMDASASGPFEYDWGNATWDNNPSNGSLPPNTYTIEVTDGNGCTTTFTETVAEPTLITASVDPMAPMCFGEANGSATVTAAGGSGSGYTYTWCNLESGATVNNLSPGNCTVTVSEGGCSEEFNFVVPDAVEITAAVDGSTDALCNGADDGTIDVTSSGGSGNLSYNWGSGLPATEDLSDLEPGLYQLTITDDNNCEVVLNTIQISEPNPMAIAASTDDATCNQDNGSINLVVTGGSGAYTYNWPNGYPNSPDLDNIVAAGTYEVTVVDNMNCEIMQSVTVSTPSMLEVDDISATLVSCAGEMDATATVEVTGGNGPYMYDWGSGPSTDPTLPGIGAGTYNVVITDADGCNLNSSITIPDAAPISIVLENVVQTDCIDNTGSIDVSATGGTGTLDFVWNSSINSEDLTDLGPGTYNLEVSDDNNCNMPLSVTIDQPEQFTTTETTVDVTCAGDLNGSVSIATQLGSGTFSYSWSDPSIGDTDVAAGLGGGQYTVLIEDLTTGCEATVVANVAEPTPIMVTLEAITETDCIDDTGGIDVSATGGTGNLSFLWNGMFNTEDLVNQGPGVYDLVVTDQNMCSVPFQASIDAPGGFMATEVTSDVTCAGEADGSIIISTQLGSGNFTYSWSQGGVGNTNQSTTLGPGTYDILIEDDATGCQFNVTSTITEPAPIVVSLDGTTPTDCLLATGGIDVSASGGTGMLDFVWNGTINSEDLTNQGPGIYNLVVTDENMCQTTYQTSIIAPGGFSATELTTDATCAGSNNGEIIVTTVDGSGNFSYTWSDPNVGNTNQATGLTPGNYTVTIVDNDTGCNFPVSTSIDEPGVLTASGIDFDATCNEDDGSILIDVAGGNGGYMFAWTGPGFTSSDEDIIGLAPGAYNLVVTDSENCMTTLSANIGVPVDPTLVANPTDALCNGEASGSIQLSVTNPNGGGSYVWGQGGIGDTDLATNLSVGNYSVVFTDALNCTAELMNIAVGEPPLLEIISVTPNQVSCAGLGDGSATVSASGGTSGYTYNWSNGDSGDEINGISGGSYQVTVLDANGCSATDQVDVDEPSPLLIDADATPQVPCNGDAEGSIIVIASGGNGNFTYDWNNNSFDGQSTLNGLTAGSYILEVSDQMGCSEVLNFEIIEPAPLEVSSTLSNYDGFNVSCAESEDGSIDLQVSGSNGTYTYVWSNGADTEDIDNLAPDVYSVMITDDMDCTSELEVTLDAPEAIVVEYDALDVQCYGEANGAVIVTGTSGGAGGLLFGINDEPLGDGIFNGLGAGDYTIMAEDANGCTSQAYDIVIEEPSELLVIAPEDTTITYGQAFEIEANIFGGSSSLDTVIWSGAGGFDCLPGIVDCGKIIVTPTETTTYTVYVQDENGCTHEDQITLRVKKDRNVYIPNVFAPNGGVNSTFEIGVGQGVEWINTMVIVDRWGEVVFERNNFDPNSNYFGWDGTLRGKPLNSGVYVYYLNVRFIDGAEIPFKGDVTLLR